MYKRQDQGESDEGEDEEDGKNEKPALTEEEEAFQKYMNGPDETDSSDEESEEESYPAAYSSVVSVASSNSSDTKSSFSNYGTWVDIIAPGSSILSAVYDDNFASWSGTSMATPLVAGALGLVWSYYPNESADKIQQMLLRGTDNIDDNNSSYSGKIGSGRLNVFRALASGALPQLKVASYSALPLNDDDGVLNPGEIALMRVVLVNEEGWADAKNITATLSSDHWAVTMIDSEAVFPDIDSGSSGVNVADRFQFQVDVDTVSYTHLRAHETDS